MNIELRKLAQMVSVARTGSFSQAARELHITQPALSRNIAALERELGIEVFERGRRGAALTRAGALAVESAEALLRQADGLVHNIALYNRGETGQLAFGLGPMLASLLLPGLGRDFLAQRPQLRLRAVTKSAEELQRELLEGNIELFFAGVQQLTAPNLLQVEHVARLPIAHVVRAGHPLAGKRRLGSDALKGFPMLAGVELPNSVAGDGGLVCDNYHVLRETTLHSDGIWITSPAMITEELARGTLRELRLPAGDRVEYTDIGQVSRKGFALSPAAELLRSYVFDSLNC